MRSALGPALTLAVAAGVFAIGVDSGGYSLATRSSLAIVVWWALGLAMAFALWPAERPPRAAHVTGGLLAGLAVLSGVSIAWADSAEKAFNELNRVLLYLGVFVVAVLGGTRGNVRRVIDGVALGIVAVGLLALASRTFPDLVDEEVFRFLPGVTSRLSYPVNYWNGLAIFVALAFPLLLGTATATSHWAGRWLAVAPIPALAAVIYLTSSRGGAATAIVGTVMLVALTSRRAVALAAVGCGGLGSALVIAILHARPELVDGPLDSAAAASQGESAALLIALVCVAAGGLYALAHRFIPAASPQLTTRAKGVLATGAVALVVAGLVAVDPVERLERFKRAPGSGQGFKQEGFTQRHLLSGGGSGRWQFWQAAIDEFETRPLAGRGAGSYEAWWAQHGSVPGYFIRDAHSLYAETLGELGLVGLLLVLGLLASGTAAAVVRLRAAPHDDRPLVAALAATLCAFALAAAIDWIWELTVVSLVAIVCLGLLVGPGFARTRDGAAPRDGGSSARKLPRALLPALALIVITLQAIPMLANERIRDSQDAARRGDGAAALENALAARSLQPWAASPGLQLALVEEQAGNLERARGAIEEAIDRDRSDWRLRFVSARLDVKAGRIAAARRDLSEAKRLNPTSPLFAR